MGVDHIISRERREFCRETGDARPLFRGDGGIEESGDDFGEGDLGRGGQIAKLRSGVSRRVLKFLDCKDVYFADFSADVAYFLGTDVAELLASGVVPVIVEKGGNPYGKPWHGKSALMERLARATGTTLPDYREKPKGTLRLVNSPVPLCRFVKPTKPGDLVQVWTEDQLGFQLDDRQAGYMSVACCEKPKPKNEDDDPEGVWSNMATIPVAEIGVHPNNEAWHYGAALFEGVGLQHTVKDGPCFFRLKDHCERLDRGAAKVGLPKMDSRIFERASKRTAIANREYIPPYGKGRLYLRPNYVDYGPWLRVGNSRTALFCCTAVPIGTANAYYPVSDRPIQLALSEDVARAVTGGAGDVKLAGNYGATLGLLKMLKKYRDAEHPEGFKGLLFCDPTGKEVRESQASGLVFVKYSPDGRHVLVMPSLEDGDILDSITSKTIKEVAPDLGYVIDDKRHVSIGEIDKFDEALSVGTAVAVSPIHELSIVSLRGGVRVNRTVKYYSEGARQFGRGEVGQKLFDYLCAIKDGRVEKYVERYLTKVDFDEELP